MAGMKDIKMRIQSVQSTMQITKAMELVASSKLRRAKDRAETSRPYFNVLHSTLSDIAAGNTDFTSVYTRRRETKKTCFVVIAGDRGLAGGYNSNLFKLAAASMKDAGECCVLPIGKRTVELFGRRGVELVSTDYAVSAEVTVSDCYAMARLLCAGFCRGDYDRVALVYTNFVSMLTQNPAELEMLPLHYGKDQAADRKGPQPLILYEPDAETVFNAIVPEYLAGLIYGAQCESLASELAARRTAMDAASKNAAQMIDSLNLYYNRARQAAITQEITEIVAGAEGGS